MRECSAEVNVRVWARKRHVILDRTTCTEPQLKQQYESIHQPPRTASRYRLDYESIHQPPRTASRYRLDCESIHQPPRASMNTCLKMRRREDEKTRRRRATYQQFDSAQPSVMLPCTTHSAQHVQRIIVHCSCMERPAVVCGAIGVLAEFMVSTAAAWNDLQ
jgi:hypothetical protein